MTFTAPNRLSNDSPSIYDPVPSVVDPAPPVHMDDRGASGQRYSTAKDS